MGAHYILIYFNKAKKPYGFIWFQNQAIHKKFRHNSILISQVSINASDLIWNRLKTWKPRLCDCWTPKSICQNWSEGFSPIFLKKNILTGLQSAYHLKPESWTKLALFLQHSNFNKIEWKKRKYRKTFSAIY